MKRDIVYYLASPYSTPVIGDLEMMQIIKDERHHYIEYIAKQLYELGFIVIEPIASSYYKAQEFGLPSTYEYWKVRDRKLIEVSDALMVAMLDGWKESVGVSDEICYAKEIGKPIYYIELTREDKSVNWGSPLKVKRIGLGESILV